MIFNYTNNLKEAINDYFKLVIYKRSLMDVEPLTLTDNTIQLFLNTIEVYEKCIIHTFEKSNLPIAFLGRNTTFSVNEYPWAFCYVYDSDISMDVDIFPRGNIELAVTMMVRRHNDGNVIYLNSIPDRHLRAVDFSRVPVGYMTENQLSKDGEPYEATRSFRISATLPSNLLNQLKDYHDFADALYPGMRDDFHLGANYE
jgi:hypothetical protein